MRTTIALLLVVLASGSVWAQEPKAEELPAKAPRVTSIRFRLSAGMCLGYCSDTLEVSPGEATLLSSSWNKDKRKCPDLKVRSDISTKHWKELTELVDRNVLVALPHVIGCPGCADQVIETLEVRFSDHTTKSVSYNDGDVPHNLKALSEKLRALQDKLQKELSPNIVGRCPTNG